MKQLTSLRLDKKDTKKARQLANLLHFDQSTVMRNAVEIGLKKFGEETALKLYSENKLSLSEAAEVAEMAVGELMEMLSKRGIRQEIPNELLKEALKNAKLLING